MNRYHYNELANLTPQELFFWVAVDETLKQLGATIFRDPCERTPLCRYINQCVEKIEQVGTLNYPKEAIRAKLYGRVQLSMAIKSDGSLERLDINHSSGYKILDDAAKHIAFLSSPFNKFPDEIKKDTDVIEITRTWTFERKD